MDPWVGLAVSTSTCVGVSLFCSLCEAVLYSVPLTVVRSGAEAGDRQWQRMLTLKEEPARPIAGILITNTIANTAGATVSGMFAERVFGHFSFAIYSVALVIAILLFGEILPKTFGVTMCRRLGPVVALPIRGMMVLWAPLIALTNLVTRRIQEKAGETPAINEWELAALMRQGVRDGAFRPQEAHIVESVLRLDRLRVRDIMTPRTVMVALPAETIIAEAARERGLWQHGRVPIYRDDPDQVVGFVLRRDVLLNDDDVTRRLSDIAKEPLQAFELLPCDQLLELFLTERRHLAMVIDEYGQIEGLVTLEDVLETLLGREIVDESDLEPDLRQKAERLAAQRFEDLGVTDDSADDVQPDGETA